MQLFEHQVIEKFTYSRESMKVEEESKRKIMSERETGNYDIFSYEWEDREWEERESERENREVHKWKNIFRKHQKEK